MRMNEFLSDRTIGLFFKHNFGKLLLRAGKFEPEFIVATNVGFGSLSQTPMHQGISFQTMEKGFYESGFIVDNLLHLPMLKLGLGTFYRYGPYGYKESWKNIAYKFSLVFGF